MAAFDNILSLLGKWPKWKAITETPERLAELEKRLATLEERFKKAPGAYCPKCGQPDFRTEQVIDHPEPWLAEAGSKLRQMKCGSCGYEEDKEEGPHTR